MTIRTVIFDIGGVLLLDTGEGLEAKWERRLDLKEGEFIQLLWVLAFFATTRYCVSISSSQAFLPSRANLMV